MADNRSEIVFFDLETTVPARPGQGFSILEFGAILVCPRKLIELQSYSTLVCPPNLSVLDTKCERRNGITRDAVSVAPLFSAIADKVFDLLNGRIWAGHNILRFDCARIREAFAAIDRPPPEAKGIIDSLALLTERFGRRAGNMKMATLATYFGLGKQTHRSLDDVRMNLEVLKYCATVLLLESSLPDLLAGNSWVSPRTTRRTRSGEKVLPVEISNTANLTSNLENVTTQTPGEQILNLVEPIRPETEALRRLSEELTGDSILENTPTEEQPMNESPPIRPKTEAFNMRRLSEDLTGDSIQENNPTEEQPLSESPEVSHPPVAYEGCSSSSAFFTPDDVSISSINVSLFPFYRGSQRIRIMHNDVILKLLCTDLKVRFGISTKYVDQAGRPRLSFVVDAPPSLCKVLDACDNQAQKTFMQSCSLSEWRPVVSRKNGYWNFPTVRLQIPTVLTGDVARYGTEIFQKKAPSGAEEKLQFSNFNAAELVSLFTPKTSIDAFFSLDPYDYHQNAGIRLVAEKLVIHSK